MRQISTSLAVRHTGPRSAAAKVLLLAVFGLFWAQGRARAEPELSLSWTTREPLSSCPDLAWAMTRVTSELGRAPVADVREGVRAIVTIEKQTSAFRLSVRTQIAEARGERLIEGESCRELSEAAILIVALSVSEADEARARDAQHGAPTQTKDSADPVRQEKPAGDEQPAKRLGFLLRPELVVELGLLGQRPTLGPGLALGLEWGIYRVEAAGTWLLYGDMQKAGQEIALRLGAARLSGCALFGQGRVRGGPCVGVELGEVRARNTQTSVGNNTFWGAATLAARLLVGLAERLSLVLDADLVASWGRLRLLRENADGSREPFNKSLPVQLRTHLGLQVSF